MAQGDPSEAEARWRKHLEAWDTSGLSLRAFGDREGLNRNTLWGWKRRLRGVTRRLKSPKFAPVVVRDAPPVARAVVFELVSPGGLTLRIPADFDEAALVRIVRAFEAAR